MTGAGGVAAGTIVAKNYLAHARVLAASLREHEPDLPLYLLLADDVEGRFDPAAEPFRVLRLEDLGIPRLSHFLFKYSRQQVVTAVKPFLLSHLLDLGFERAIFLDADILVLDALGPAREELGRNDLVLTPHLLAPPDADAGHDRELNILRSGVCNAGFVGVAGSREARALLGWWQERVYDHCFLDVGAGAVYDQRWLDLAPGFARCHLLRDPGANVAYWNLTERRVTVGRGGRFFVGRGPCRFFHFSGYDPERPEVVTRYSQRLAMRDIGAASALFDRYRRLLEAAGHREASRLPYAFDRFENGEPIPDLARQIFWANRETADRFGNPFATKRADSFRRWLRDTGALRS